jgi:hypothetical protein
MQHVWESTGIPEGRSVGRPRRRWEDVTEVGWRCINWVGLAPDRDQWCALVNTAMKLQFSSNSGKLLSRRATGGVSRRAPLPAVFGWKHQSRTGDKEEVTELGWLERR